MFNDFITDFITALEQVQAKETEFEAVLTQLRHINSQK